MYDRLTCSQLLGTKASFSGFDYGCIAGIKPLALSFFHPLWGTFVCIGGFHTSVSGKLKGVISKNIEYLQKAKKYKVQFVVLEVLLEEVLFEEIDLQKISEGRAGHLCSEVFFSTIMEPQMRTVWTETALCAE